ncbi:MAG: hypothetical protein ACJAY8_000867 [Sphingobacteriales bacterium]|jgi:hypothetical protein
MKKYFLSLVCIGLLSVISSAQDSYKKTNIALHFSGHIVSLKPQSNSAIADGAASGYSFGAIIDRHFEKNYAFTTGFSVMNSGIKDQLWEKENESYTKYNRKIKIQYIEIPTILKLKTNEIGYMTYYGNIGLSSGFRLKSTFEKSFGDQKVDSGNAKEETSIFRSALVIGGGMEYNVSGSTNILVGINYHNGFTNVLKGDGVAENNGVFTIEKQKAYANFVELKLGIFF